MLEINDTDATRIISFVEELPDPRSEVNRLHPLGDVIVIAICGVIANADGPSGIEKWARLNVRCLEEHLAIPNGNRRASKGRGNGIGSPPPAQRTACG